MQKKITDLLIFTCMSLVCAFNTNRVKAIIYTPYRMQRMEVIEEPQLYRPKFQNPDLVTLAPLDFTLISYHALSGIRT